ncbi:hypothetical protein F4679DRAFT_395945 [Xylaria curta]|nr:hypothetical protein F4679DRAFT_395945 [Xylaria curta]
MLHRLPPIRFIYQVILSCLFDCSQSSLQLGSLGCPHSSKSCAPLSSSPPEESQGPKARKRVSLQRNRIPKEREGQRELSSSFTNHQQGTGRFQQLARLSFAPSRAIPNF